jgi:hypothetical protein
MILGDLELRFPDRVATHCIVQHVAVFSIQGQKTIQYSNTQTVAEHSNKLKACSREKRMGATKLR